MQIDAVASAATAAAAQLAQVEAQEKGHWRQAQQQLGELSRQLQVCSAAGGLLRPWVAQQRDRPPTGSGSGAPHTDSQTRLACTHIPNTP
jgi:hypothetical protein